jgi:hypothetical protein
MFTYNPVEETYDHPLYRSVSKRYLLDRIRCKLGEHCGVVGELVNNASSESAELAFKTIYEKTIGNSVSANYPAIEILTLLTEQHPKVIEMLWFDYDYSIDPLYPVKSGYKIHGGIKAPISGHLLLSDTEEDVSFRFHLLLLLGFRITYLYTEMVECIRHYKSVRKRISHESVTIFDRFSFSNIIRNFKLVMTLIFDIGEMPCNFFRDSITIVPNNGEWQTYIQRDTFQDYDLYDLDERKKIKRWCTLCCMYTKFYYDNIKHVHTIYVKHIKSQSLFDRLHNALYPILQRATK